MPAGSEMLLVASGLVAVLVISSFAASEQPASDHADANPGSAPDKPPLPYENFERYYIHTYPGHNGPPTLPLSIHPRRGGGIENWLICPWGEWVDPTLSTEYKCDGHYSLKMSYTSPAGKSETNISRVYENPNLDWTGYNAVRFWLKPDGTGRTFEFFILPQYRTAKFPNGTPGKQFFACELALDGTQPRVVTMPFSCFKGPGRLIGQPINEIAFWILSARPGIGAIYIDRIEAVCVPEGSPIEVALVSPPPTLPGDRPTRIHVGSAQPLVDKAAQTWLADSDFYCGGDTVAHGEAAISGDDNEALYRTQRLGPDGYRLPLPNGSYRVRLHFAEMDIRCNATGKRVFGLNVGGTDLGRIDVFAEGGGLAKALVKEVAVTVGNGLLEIDFGPVVNYPTLAGIEVIPVGKAE